MNLEKRLDEGFIPMDEMGELIIEYGYQLDPVNPRAIGILNDGKNYWFRIAPGGMELYLTIDCYQKIGEKK